MGAVPYNNGFRRFFKSITDTLIKDPVRQAVQEGSAGLATMVNKNMQTIANNTISAGAAAGAGNLMGGVSSGLIGGGATLGGIALAEIVRSYTDEQRNQDLVDKLFLKLNERKEI